jgi:membrane fusion protein (multidrug efflux system)
MEDKDMKPIKDEKMILEMQRAIVEEERAILNEEKKTLKALRFDATLLVVMTVVVIAVASSAFLFIRAASQRITSDNAQVTATEIDLAPQVGGTLEETYVRPGDTVTENEPVARISGELVKAKIAGEILSVQDDIGTQFAPGQTVATMIDRSTLRVEVRVEEDKGLKDIRPGQLATFTVDAFGSKRYVGTVDEVSPMSRVSDAVFSISDKRETQEFNVKIRFDADAYPEIKDGMSAKVVIYKE